MVLVYDRGVPVGESPFSAKDFPKLKAGTSKEVA